jgi:menaquinone-dependent protoporphyrinogen IX oxidase
MNIAYYHASRYGNGAAVADEFVKAMTAKGIAVDVHHIRDADPKHLPVADAYVFSSPGRMGRPTGGARRFLRKVDLTRGAPYALLTTEMAPQPDKKTGRMPTQAEIERWQRVRPLMTELLDAKGLTKVAEDCVHVTGLKGPLEDGWTATVDAFADRVAEVAHLHRD